MRPPGGQVQSQINNIVNNRSTAGGGGGGGGIFSVPPRNTQIFNKKPFRGYKKNMRVNTKCRAPACMISERLANGPPRTEHFVPRTLINVPDSAMLNKEKKVTKKRVKILPGIINNNNNYGTKRLITNKYNRPRTIPQQSPPPPPKPLPQQMPQPKQQQSVPHNPQGYTPYASNVQSMEQQQQPIVIKKPRPPTQKQIAAAMTRSTIKAFLNIRKKKIQVLRANLVKIEKESLKQPDSIELKTQMLETIRDLRKLLLENNLGLLKIFKKYLPAESLQKSHLTPLKEQLEVLAGKFKLYAKQ